MISRLPLSSSPAAASTQPRLRPSELAISGGSSSRVAGSAMMLATAAR
jgi:hypothetical protein